MDSTIFSNTFTGPHPIASSSSSDYDAASKLDIGSMISDLAFEYREREDENMENTGVHWRRKQFDEWRDWYIANYPSTNPKSLFMPHGKDLDLRVLFMALPIAAYSILLFLEICYDVDKTLCGSDSSALSWIKQWHMPREMGAFNYLLSEEMYLWWKTELCEFSNEIRNPASNRVSIAFRLRELGSALTKMNELVDCGRDCDLASHTISTRIWSEYWEGGFDVPEPPRGIFKGVFGRWCLLKDSFKIFVEEMNLSQPREEHLMSLVPISSGTFESEGFRHSIPRESSSDDAQIASQPTSIPVVQHEEARQNSNLPASDYRFHVNPASPTLTPPGTDR
ncbi:hypothetical protein BDZ45DRAFT_802698 [Acephala macrosclerotiorum]|nr:hypothetical protein BDZ45DRAFT_802698 [Acephala macrosclerotiorum]